MAPLLERHLASKARAGIKRQRPGWWDQVGVLSRLQAGQFIGAICQEASAELAGIGIEVSPITLRADVSKWVESLSWGEQFKLALGMWKRLGSGEMVLAKHWHDDFLGAMEACQGNAQKAAEMAGIGYGIVLALTDKRNKCYDPDFAEKFKIAELARIGPMRERYMVTAETGEGKESMRAQERLIEAAIPGLHGQKQEVLVSGKVDHDHQHTHGISAGLAREIIQASQDRVRKLGMGRQGLLPDDTRTSGEVIDVTPIREQERVLA